MSDWELKVDPGAVCLTWSVDPTTSHRLFSREFPYDGGNWRLYFLHGPTASPCIYLQKESGECSLPFRTSVEEIHHRVEGERSVRVPSLSQVTHFTTGDFSRNRAMKQIWVKKMEEILAAVPEYRLNSTLTLIVILKPAEDTDSSAGRDSGATLTVFHLNEDVGRACSTASTSYQNAAPCLEMLSEDFDQLLVQGLYTDMEFQCAGQTIKGHKSIVCSRSPVMASMLATDMVEGRTGVVTIPNIEPDVFQHFLRYLYSGKMEELTFDTALALYGVGDQYDVRGLARRCSDFLIQQLSVENACEVLAIADAHGDSKMAEKVIEYILENDIPLISTDSRATQTEFDLNEDAAAPCLEMLSEDFDKLLVQGSYPDMEFQCAGQTIKGHKSIVCSRSPVMASMLATDMVEGRTGVVTIRDIEPDVFQHFLKYLYSGRVQELTFDTALALYGVGDQYEVRGLAKRCSDILIQQLSVENACELLAFADAHGDSKMAVKVIEYILDNDIPLVSECWSQFCKDHSELAIEVLTRFYTSMVSVKNRFTSDRI